MRAIYINYIFFVDMSKMFIYARALYANIFVEINFLHLRYLFSNIFIFYLSLNLIMNKCSKNKTLIKNDISF